ncbi:MAG: metallophosphoesterase family protein [Acidobacteriota bacterium]
MIDLQIAVVSDIHGNSWALEAVLADIEKRDITWIVNLGDTVYGPLDPRGTAEMLMPRKIVNVRGNEDRLITEHSGEGTASPTPEFVRRNLRAEQIAWLRMHQPTETVGAKLFACHGTPGSDVTYLLEDISPMGPTLRAPDQIMASLEKVSEPVVLCGHSHVPWTVWLPNGQLVVNPGSVGLPAYSDDQPVAHVMQAGSPHARYAVVAKSGAGWQVDHVAVPYDWARASARARENGRADWAEWLRSGRAR